LSRITPLTAGAVGIGLPLMNPKVLFANAAAGLVIGGIDRRHAVLTAVILVVIGLVLLYQGIRAV
jgi:hypothetical protein